MLKPRARARAQHGFNLVELMVTIAIFTFLVMMAAPSFSEWIQNSRIRVTAEAMLAGLQAAKSEAVGRNARVRFQLTSTLDNACVLDVAGRNWVVNLDPLSEADRVEGACDTPPDPANPAAAPGILQTRPAAEGSQSVVVRADQSSVVFNGVGQPVPLPAATLAIDITNPGGGACAANGGPMTCLRIQISPAGQLRMCNPNFPAGDPQAC